MSAPANFWQARPVLITGGAGFCGAHLCETLLRQGAHITVLDRSYPRDSYFCQAELNQKVAIVTGDILDLPNLKLLCLRRQIDTVFHLAAQPIVSISNALPADTAAVNIIGTYNVLESVRASKEVRALVFASSGAYYGATNASAAIPEDAPALAASNIYAPTKAAADLAVRCYARVYGMQAAVCRWMNTYGPGDTNFSRIIPATIRLLLRREQPRIDGTDGTNVLEMLHIRDMIAAYIRTAECIADPGVGGEAFNFGGGNPMTLRDLVIEVTRAWNAVTGEHVPEAPVITGPRVDSVKYLDISKAKARLGWAPSIGLQDGLRESIEWYQKNWLHN